MVTTRFQLKALILIITKSVNYRIDCLRETSLNA
jgi:hypothetical protein